MSVIVFGGGEKSMFDSRVKDRRFKPKWDTSLKKKKQDSSDESQKNKGNDAKEKEKSK